MDTILKETNFTNLGERSLGKVRDIYRQGDKTIFISTDRHSSFDRIIAHIPQKGQVLNLTSAFWFNKTKHIIPNHVLAIPDPSVTVAKTCKPLPIEAVVRGYLTGTTNTSIWTLYKNGQRDFGTFELPEGMQKNQQLEHPVLTPSTKSKDHDITMKPQDMIDQGIISQELYNRIEHISFELFMLGQEIALARGLILVDTKYEFGLDEHGNLILIDEIHTPDSSRYWQASSYEDRLQQGEEPEFFDKEFLRLWFNDHCDPYNDEVLPEAPHDMVIELAHRYQNVYQQLIGGVESALLFDEPLERLENNLKPYVI